ncbi:hypothetical protein BJY04DRAFT_187566, partial [Aspergillus karnatakaensis]|uniref:uncharacterized protein n=1 Tax=Aspergillus karnatakaensis TaxID=1810916 RepID=UPI003CCE4EE2
MFQCLCLRPRILLAFSFFDTANKWPALALQAWHDLLQVVLQNIPENGHEHLTQNQSQSPSNRIPTISAEPPSFLPKY